MDLFLPVPLVCDFSAVLAVCGVERVNRVPGMVAADSSRLTSVEFCAGCEDSCLHSAAFFDTLRPVTIGAAFDVDASAAMAV